MYSFAECQKILLPQGAIYLGPSDASKSVGYLELKSHTSLTLHNRPAIEKLTQVKNKSEMVVFWDKKPITILHEGDTFVIKPANTWHIHVNPFNEVSLTYWDFDGDIREIIDNIRNANK